MPPPETILLVVLFLSSSSCIVIVITATAPNCEGGHTTHVIAGWAAQGFVLPPMRHVATTTSTTALASRQASFSTAVAGMGKAD